MDIAACMAVVRPTGEYTCNANDYNQLVMLDGTLKPTLFELQAAEMDANKAKLKAKVGAKRYAVEVAGINFTYRTVPIPVSTARASQEKIDAARNMVRDSAWVDGSNWKFADGVFRPMTAVEITAMCDAVRTHIKACFENEAVKFAEINATGTTDVNTGWPATANTPVTTTFQN